ncbi:MAG: hypothetical protein PHE77_02440 [Candidatus Pacebacteria bacterium]|nr:hypothetical protein [Candidatus Paceibacterota bacterium]
MKMTKINYHKALKKKAIELRGRGLSYKEIKQEIGVSKSTLSGWLKTVELTPEQKERLYTKQVMILSRGSQSQKERRLREIERIIAKAEKEIESPMSFETYRLFGAALYWAEGAKTNGCSIINSDPHLILFMVRWLEKVFKIYPDTLKVWLNIYSQQNDKDLKAFWSRLTGIPIENFGKSFIKPVNKNFKKNNLYYGTVKVKIPKGTDLRHRIFGWVKCALKDLDFQIDLTQKEWKSLKEVDRPANL